LGVVPYLGQDATPALLSDFFSAESVAPLF
jgi:hypothetical protein